MTYTLSDRQPLNAGAQPTTQEDAIRGVVADFGAAIQMPSLALNDGGRVDLMVGETPVAICLVRRPEAALWVGCEVGVIAEDQRAAIEWLLHETFALWAFERVTLGRDEKSGVAQAFVLLTGDALGPEFLEGAVGRLVTLAQPLRARVAQQDFPPVTDQPIDPALQAIQV